MTKYLILLLTLLTVGCANGEPQPNGEDIERDEASTQELMASIETGSNPVEELPVTLIQQDRNPEVLADKLDAEVLTGEYFLHNGSGKFGYGVTGGFIDETETVSVNLMSHDGEVEVKDHLQITLYQVDKNLTLTQINQTSYTDLSIDSDTALEVFEVPEELGVYLVYLTFIDEEGEMIDQLIQPIYQLEAEHHASLNVEANEATEEMTLMLTNHAIIPISLGMHYQIEQKVGNTWYQVPLDLAFIEIQLTLGYNQVHEQAIDISQLESGDYRVVKSFFDVMNQQQTTLAKEFSIDE